MPAMHVACALSTKYSTTLFCCKPRVQTKRFSKNFAEVIELFFSVIIIQVNGGILTFAAVEKFTRSYSPKDYSNNHGNTNNVLVNVFTED